LTQFGLLRALCVCWIVLFRVNVAWSMRVVDLHAIMVCLHGLTLQCTLSQASCA